MLDTLGKRLKCCRAATNTTAQEVVNHINETTTKESLSYASYTRWEADKVIPKRKNNLISYIADFFTNNGLYVSTEWLCNGEGFPPQFIEYKNLDEDTLFILAARNMKGCEIIQIGGTYGEPYVSFGEICIASKLNNINDSHGKLCFIEDINNNLYIGIMYVASDKNILLKRQDEIEIEKINIKECKKNKMDKEKIKIGFNAQSAKLIDFLSHFKKITYASTLLVIDNQITDHQSNGYAGWDKKFYYDGLHKDSLLIKVGIELTKIKEGETSTVIWDDVLKTDPKNKIKELRESNNIYHGISFIYGLSENISLSINTCTSKDIKKEDFENFILPMRFELLNFFKELNNVY